MNSKQSGTVAICTVCKSVIVCGESCRNCGVAVDNLKIAKYTNSLKEAMRCWNSVECDDHKDLCQPKVKEFAIKLLELQNKIEKLESLIRSHKYNKKNPDSVDQSLWEYLEHGQET